jgi:UDP-2,3-diacylglucosamine pyrophosphatase LpxH
MPILTDPVRAVFISDLHLGSKCSQAAALDSLLRQSQYERLYIVGDFFDEWLLARRKQLRGVEQLRSIERLHAVAQTVLSLVDRGIEVHYLMGNHDRELQTVIESWGLASVGERLSYECADGKRLLVIHGDQFDLMQVRFPNSARIAARFHEGILRASKLLNAAGSRRVSRHRSFGTLMTIPFKRLMQTYSRFDIGIKTAISEANAHGIVFGHTHSPMLLEDDRGVVANTGDWLENCTVLLESHSGQLELWGGSPTEWYRWSPRRLRVLPPIQSIEPTEPVKLASS